MGHETTMSSQKAREEWSRLLSLVEFKGVEIVITRQGRPVAMVVPYKEGQDATLVEETP